VRDLIQRAFSARDSRFCLRPERTRAALQVQVPTAPPSSLSVFGHRGESIEKRTCARASRSLEDPESISFGGIRPNWPIPLRRDLPGSADHRRAFAYDSRATDLEIIATAYLKGGRNHLSGARQGMLFRAWFHGLNAILVEYCVSK